MLEKDTIVTEVRGKYVATPRNDLDVNVTAKW